MTTDSFGSHAKQSPKTCREISVCSIAKCPIGKFPIAKCPTIALYHTARTSAIRIMGGVYGSVYMPFSKPGSRHSANSHICTTIILAWYCTVQCMVSPTITDSSWGPRGAQQTADNAAIDILIHTTNEKALPIP